MATYKVIQDIEAEDKLLGPLSFRQFLYFLVAAFLGFLNFTALTKGAWPVFIVLGPPMFFCLFFAWPWSPDQPTEVWALARIRYYLKPRKRLWNQSGVKEFVTITVPKKVEKIYTDGLSQDQVRSRLEALSQTIDSRGWAVKNAYHGSTLPAGQATDRLVGFDNMPLSVSDFDVRDEDDVLDAINNPAAYQMGQMIDASSKAHRKALMDKLRAKGANPPQAPAAPEWFQRKQMASQPLAVTAAPAPAGVLPTVPAVPPVLAPATQPVAQPQPIIAPVIDEPVTELAAAEPKAPVEATKPAADPAILNLAHDNNMDVATLAREAARKKSGELDEGEVVVALH